MPSPRLQSILKQWGDQVAQSIREELDDTINIKNNIFVVTSAMNVSIFLPFYSTFIDSGRRAGASPPPIKAIMEWAASRGIDVSAAYPIARKIGRDGIPARPIFRLFDNALPDLSNRISEITADFILTSSIQAANE